MACKSKRVQVDEVWQFTAAKQKNVAAGMKRPVDGAGDTWTWTALDADSKLIVQWFVGGRDGDAAKLFIDDLASRLANRVQLTSDGHRAYLEAVEDAFGADIDYAMLQKIYGPSPEGQRRYSPAECIGTANPRDRRQPRSGAHQHVIRGAVEPEPENAQPPLYAADQRLLEEVREPLPRAGAVLHVLQLGAHPQDAEGDARHGRWPDRQAVEHGRRGSNDRSCIGQAGSAQGLQEARAANFKLRHYPTV